MNSVKSETGNICRGCLCVDRILLPLNENVDLFFIFLGNELSVSEDCKFYNILLCWECIALLKKAAVFRKRVQTAHSYFEGLLSTPISELTTLKTYKKDHYDQILVQNEDFKPKVKPESLLFEVPLQVDVYPATSACHIKEEGYQDDDDDDRFASDPDEESKPDMPIMVKEEKKKKKKKLNPLDKRINKRTIKYTDAERVKYIENVDYTLKDVLSMERDTKKSFKIKNMDQYTNILIKKMYETKIRDLSEKVENGGIKCSECDTMVENHEAMAEHWDAHPVALLRCHFCGILSKSRKYMNCHLGARHSIIYSCTLCNMEFRALPQYHWHYRSLHKTQICDYCGKKFHQKSGIEHHIRVKHTPAVCHICKFEFKQKSYLEEHMLIKHQIKEERKKPIVEELAYCVECDLQFPSEYFYKRHLEYAVAHRRRVREKVPCPDCGKIFSRKVYMVNHYKLVHVRKSQHYCEQCDKHFINGFALRTHKKFVHEKNEKPKNKICDLCGRGFHTNRMLINHKRTHTGERPHKCSYCLATFAQDFARKTHEKSQHKHLLRTTC
ncbi:zinc finger protein 468-like isoform X2 [Maniola hyperantus]|uniref:zinc finger protein 468-like isoform X2 n=1 Tax=Aphantopus hyperantus TaxID=2795564 RepID=UPI0037485363